MAAASAVPGIPAEDISRLRARPSDASADRRKLTNSIEIHQQRSPMVCQLFLLAKI
jgi:hypothetical protein